MEFKKGDIVEFIGTRHFKSPSGRVFFTIKPGVAKITAVMEGPKVKHPYYLIAEPGSESTVKGWVDENDIKEIEKKIEIKAISFANSKKVRVAFAKNVGDNMEIVSENWKQNGWTAVCRAKDPKLAEELAHAAEVGCAKKVFKDTEANTTTFAEICLEVAQKPIYPANATNLVKGGLFSSFTSQFYLGSSEYLRRGDILLSGNTSAIVLSNGKNSARQMPIRDPESEKEIKEEIIAPKEKKVVKMSEMEVIKAADSPEEKDESLAGIYKVTIPAHLKTGVDIRNGALLTLPAGTKVENFGFYTTYNNVKFLYVQTIYKDKIYNGFVSERCLIK